MALTVAQVSPISSISIRESTLGQYLESITTRGTWIHKVQEYLGVQEPIQFTMLDATYTASGIGGILLAISSGGLIGPALVTGSALIGLTAIGMNEEDRRTKIGTGIVLGSSILTHPTAFAYTAKEAYKATTETVKATVDLASSGIGFTTATLGVVTSVCATSLIVAQSKKRKRSS